jgi:hypothetical protein
MHTTANRHVDSLSIIGGVLIVALSLCLSCNSPASSHKELNESTARDMIRENLSKRPLKLPLARFGQMMNRSQLDYTSFTPSSEAEVIFKRLLNGKFAEQTIDKVQYPMVSGTFVWVEKTNSPEWDPVTNTYELDLYMVQNSNKLIGLKKEFRESKIMHVSDSGRLDGTIQPEGGIELDLYSGNMKLGWNLKGNYSEKADKAYLNLIPGPISGPSREYVGKATGKTIQVNWYTYSWSADFRNRMVNDNNNFYVVGGKIEAGNVSDLRLVTDTEATARVHWVPTPNDIGKLFDLTPQGGTFSASFAKKPDGTWFLDRIGGISTSAQ